MATLTIRKLDDEVMEQFKEIARRHNRSAEAEARSLLEEFTAEHIARRIMTSTDLVAQMQQLLDGEGLDDHENLVPERNTYDHAPRPVILGDDNDHS